jgi:hypothetical protein
LTLRLFTKEFNTTLSTSKPINNSYRLTVAKVI